MMEVTDRPSRVPWPPIIYLAAIAVGAVPAVLVPLPWLGSPLADLLFAAGWLLVLAAVLLEVAAIHTLRRANTTMRVDRAADHLVVSGPYAFSRNPIYLGNSMLMLGIGFVAGSLWFILLAFVAGFLTQKLAIEP